MWPWARILVQSGSLTALALVFHIALRVRASYAHPVILPIVLDLIGIGIAMIQSLDAAAGTDAGGNQFKWTAVSVLIAAAVLWFLKDHRSLRRYTFIALAVILPLVPGIATGDINGASVWIRLGPPQFQPGNRQNHAGCSSSGPERLVFAVADVEPEHFPASVRGDPDCDDELTEHHTMALRVDEGTLGTRDLHNSRGT